MMTPNGAVPSLTWPYSVAAVPDGIGLRPQTMPRPRTNLRSPSKPVESPKRHIELAVVKVEGDKVTFKIADQTHRNDEFSQQVNSDELCLLSHSVPEWLPYASALYCCGKGKAQDLCEITCTTIEFVRISEAVAEYNATDGKGREPRWPQEGDKYFCIAVDGKLDRLTFDRSEVDRKLQDFGNFFRTEEEAEAALERVKQVLKGGAR